ncbi:hypothetical protein [Runella limosa]|uniref:hypothetical protein n=1 Tax=Runella limosa TaxID=370978 RepID=UPI00041CF478|nr:hypothetical protein [Runella limosa]
MPPKADRLLFVALIVAVLFHGSALVYTIDKTYDAFVHIFFGDHYARLWFEPWEYRWYTGFPVISYPPLSHQLIAFLSKIGGLKFGFGVVILSALCFFIVGIYRFSQLWVPKRSAGYAALFAVVASSIVQTIHIYGQLPTMIGIACLTNALPEVYGYFRTEQKRYLVTGLAILGVTVASHHVTTIFGMVFFIAPIIATALLDQVGVEGSFFKVAKDAIVLAFTKWKLIVTFFLIAGIEIVLIIFPYWFWSKTDPITQVSIPHGSRDSFIEVTSSGLMFFIIPLGFTLLMLPYIFRSLYTRRTIFLALSFSLLLLLGTGGTTPIPKLLLGKNAFEILTLDRFTFWASVIAIPFVGDFFKRLVEGDIRERIIGRYGKKMYRFMSVLMIGLVGFQALLIVDFHKLRALQPSSVDIQPILSFLERDQHDRWRFMTLGFGDQMAWLSANTMALSIDGNYHSARRVPEMTSQPLERLENSKFKGVQGIGSLQQFLTIPEKYHLKFIFSNDKFYDPILYFAGWERLQRLENGIMVWQKHDVPTLPSVLPQRDMPVVQKRMWGILPLCAFLVMLTVLYYYRRVFLSSAFPDVENRGYNAHQDNRWLYSWMAAVLIIAGGFWLKALLTSYQKDPVFLVKSYYNALDFKRFKEVHSYFPPHSIGFDDYVLQLSVRDGLLASYGKLDAFSVKILEKQPTQMRVLAITDWVTPLERYHQETEHTVVKIGTDWFIEPPIFDQAIPPDEHIEKGVLGLHSQGKRKITTATTEHDDVLDRPELHILSAKLMKIDSQYVVVGEIQNIDHLPAHLTIEAQLFDKQRRKLVSYNAKYVAMHNVLPKEIVPFRIEFEETAWVKEEDKNPLKFNPTEFTAYRFTHQPTEFRLFARAVVADRDMYRDAGVQQIKVVGTQKIKGEVYNHGIDEISVPQLLFTYYDQAQTVRWVDHLFLKEGVRQQAKQVFEKKLPNFDQIRLVRAGTINDFFVNGLPQSSFLNHITMVNRPSNDGLLPLPTQQGYVRFLVNAYIGNPTLY